MQGETSCLCCGKRECCSKADTAEAHACAALQVLVIPTTVWQELTCCAPLCTSRLSLKLNTALLATPHQLPGIQGVGTARLSSWYHPVGHC